MSLNELAVDLTCDPTPFTLPRTDRPSQSRPAPGPSSSAGAEVPKPVHTMEPIYDEQEEEDHIPGSFPFPVDVSVPFPRSRKVSDLKAKSAAQTAPFPRMRVLSESVEDGAYFVHGGMLKMTRAMGGPGRPVHNAIRDALRRNKGHFAFAYLSNLYFN